MTSISERRCPSSKTAEPGWALHKDRPSPQEYFYSVCFVHQLNLRLRAGRQTRDKRKTRTRYISVYCGQRLKPERLSEKTSRLMLTGLSSRQEQCGARFPWCLLESAFATRFRSNRPHKIQVDYRVGPPSCVLCSRSFQYPRRMWLFLLLGIVRSTGAFLAASRKGGDH